MAFASRLASAVVIATAVSAAIRLPLDEDGEFYLGAGVIVVGLLVWVVTTPRSSSPLPPDRPPIDDEPGDEDWFWELLLVLVIAAPLFGALAALSDSDQVREVAFLPILVFALIVGEELLERLRSRPDTLR